MTVPFILIFGIWTFLLVKTGKVSVGAAIVLTLFGLFLATTGLGPGIRDAAAAFGGWVVDAASSAAGS